MKIREKENEVSQLKEQFMQQADSLAKLQQNIDYMIIDSKFNKNEESKYFKKEFVPEDMNRQIFNLQASVQ